MDTMKKISQVSTSLLPYCCFLLFLGFLVSPSFKSLNNIFYLTFLPITLLCFRKYFSDIIRCPIFLWLIALATWMALSSSWAQIPEYKNLKSICYVIIFIIGISLIDEINVLKKWGFLILPGIILPLFLGEGFSRSRLSGYGPTEHPLYAGQIYLFFTWLFLNYREFHTQPNISKLIRWTGFLLSFVACYMTQSRSVIVCLPLIIFVFSLQNMSKIHRLKSLAVLAVALPLSALFAFNNQWITLPSHNIDYQINLDEGEALLVKFRKPDKSIAAPTIKRNSDPIEMILQDSGQKIFRFTAKENGTYNLKIKLSKKTSTPWAYVTINTRKLNKKLEPLDIFTPPRAFQLDPTLNQRTSIWKTRFNQWMEKPFFGYGFSHHLPIPIGKGYVNDSHNFFIGTAFHGGLVALLLYLGLLFSSLYRLSPKNYWSFLALLICGIITTSFDDENFFTSTRPHWLLLLFPIGQALKVELAERMPLTVGPHTKSPPHGNQTV